MAETKEAQETIYRFEDIDDETVNVTVIGPNGSAPYEVTLTAVTWGMLEDIMTVQETSKEDPRAIFSFMNDHIEGGARSVPLKHTMSLFGAIAEYMNQVMDTQKN
jgi:hypothetical protein